MAIAWYLAMSESEIAACRNLPRQIAWMDCSFSSGDPGLSGLPASLPHPFLLMVTDRTPVSRHDPALVFRQLRQVLTEYDCTGVLLDFQNSGPESGAMAAELISSLPCPVAVCDTLGKELNCPVFLSPCPHHVPLREHIAPWKGREMWLDMALDAQTITVTRQGAAILPEPVGEIPSQGHRDNRLHCHYSVETAPDFIRFTLWRTREDLQALAQEAETLGVTTLLGLYQELN